MSIVIIGGNECMERQYKDLCKKQGHKAKVFCKMQGCMNERIGSPDVLVLFTHTCSHKMVQCALCGLCEKTKVVRSHNSSMASLRAILADIA